MRLASADAARAIDALASGEWGIDQFALVEAAGRACADVLVAATGDLFTRGRPRLVFLVGSGNNGADALVMLRSLVIHGHIEAREALVVLNKAEPGGVPPRSPRGEALKSVAAQGVPLVTWDRADERIVRALREADLIVDGLSGTGIEGPLRGAAAEMCGAIGPDASDRAEKRPLVVSVDVPSGIGDAWKKGMPAVRADLTLAIEPRKAALYLPDARAFAGAILPVSGIFPRELLERTGAVLIDWAEAARLLPPVSPTAYKHERGVVEIRAGAAGTVGAAALAAAGAQAGGAGLVRLVVDADIRNILAASSYGVMVAAADEPIAGKRFSPDCVLAGPGWGRGADRVAALASLADAERSSLALVLDADAVPLARAYRFSGNAILTPHLGEFAEYRGLSKEEVLADPDAAVKAAAEAANAVVVLKGHVTRIAASDGRVAVIDGMAPALAMGGSGDVLAGLTAAIAARAFRAAAGRRQPFDPFPAAVAASALLAETGRRAARETGFCDAADIARLAGRLAADAWLTGDAHG